MTKLVGQPLPRVEDRRFLTGTGQFTDDLEAANQVYVAVVRSPHAHARIGAVDLREALAAPTVVGAFTAADLREAGIGAIPCSTRTEPFRLLNRDGSEMALADQYPLAEHKVRFSGEAVAFVVAETPLGAREAAERVEVDYTVLEAVTDIDAALADDAALVWDETPANRSFDWAAGDEQAVDRAFTEAARVTTIEVINPRLIVAFMEPRAVRARYDTAEQRYVLQVGCQSAHMLRNNLAGILGEPPERLRVVVPDTGGGFGARNVIYPEFVLCAFAARKLGRPVAWTADRAESFLTDTQARGHRLSASLAMDGNGRFTGIRVSSVWRHGAYIPNRNLHVLVSNFAPMICGVYTIPVSHCEVRGVFTHTAPVASLRGVARAEAVYVVERLINAAARETDRDPVALRRLNMIRANSLPYATPAGAKYHAVDFAANLDVALGAAKWGQFAQRRAESATRGRLRGLGLSTFVEVTGGAPAELAEIEVEVQGDIVAAVGTQDFGMGHATAFAQVLADELGVDFSRIRIEYGDSDRIRMGFGAHGSRAMRIGGSAVVFGARAMLEKAKQLAAEHLEAAATDIDYANGCCYIVGTDRGVELAELARVAHAKGDALAGEYEYQVAGPSYTNGCHVCEVEIDPDTGVVSLLDHVLMVDVGLRVNPLIVDGQLHGGLTQGIGQALFEDVVYAPDNGQLLSASFMDYNIPKADQCPAYTTGYTEVPTRENPLGVKGAGECGTTGSPAAVMNAVIDALRGRGVTHLDMPATPERVWRALRGE